MKRASEAKVHRLVVICMLLGAIALLGSCASQKAWRYSVMSKPGPVVLDRSVAVPPFADERPNVNNNLWALYMIPLMPFGWSDLDSPEGVQMHMTSGIWIWRPNEDLAKAAAEELQAASLFKEAFFTNRQSEGDLVFKGTINSTRYEGKLLSYLVSFAAPYLWLVGAPASYVTNKLDILFTLSERESGKVIWKNSYELEESHLSWIYYLQSDFNYSELFQGIMEAAVDDMRADLRNVTLRR